MIKLNHFYKQVEAYGNPAIILFRSIELKLVKKTLAKLRWKTCLDLGCGDGIAAKVIFNKQVKYGLDNDKFFLEKGRKSGRFKKLLLAEAEKIPLKSGECDLVFSNCVIEHIRDLDPVFKEVNRVLKKDGYFVFTSLTENFSNYSVFSFLNWRELSEKYGQFRDRRLQHYHGYNFREWKKRLKKRGFKVVDKFYYLDKATTEWWDFLMLWSYFFAHVNKKLDWWLYEKIWKEKIYSKYIDAEAVDDRGAAIGIVVQKI
ncbi:class I SAM-dependent methyltransferase [Microgenomates group bacterium]|nr:class I SAM-dependent methyltransferase [Microgenomates group bacterium]